MATITVRDSDEDGVELFKSGTASPINCSSGGDEFVNTGEEIVFINNGSGGALTVTFAKTSDTDIIDPIFGKVTKANVATAVGAGKTVAFGPFPIGGFNDANSKVQITYSGVTSLTIDVVKVNIPSAIGLR